jgi:PAS domain S-box-containing protein
VVRSGRGRGRPGRDLRPLAAAILVLVLGLALALVVTWLRQRGNDAHVAHELDGLATETTDRIFERFHRYEYGLRGIRGSVLVAGHDGLSRAKIRVYAESREIGAEFPGARGFGFIRRVPVEREAAFVAAARRDGMPDFSVVQLDPSGRERYVIEYIEPLARNRLALGLDIGSEARRRAAADLALRTGKVAITRPITLVQAPEDTLQGFLVLLPVYQPGLPLVSEADRDAAAFGWTYAPLVIAEVLEGFDFRGGEFGVTLYDDGEGEGQPAERFYGPAAPQEPGDAALVRRITRPIFGRTWQVELRAGPGFVAGLNLLEPGVMFATGALLSALLAALIYAYMLGRYRQREVIAGQLHLATIVEHSSDAIIAEALDGTVTSWNRAAERIFGFRADEAVGQPSGALVRPVTSERNQDSMVMSLQQGEAIEAYDQVCRRRDGSLIEVSITASPITAADGRVIGLGKTIRDIRVRKSAERQLQDFSARLERQVSERTSQLDTARRDLQTILDALPSIVGYWDARLICRFANHAYHLWFGVDPQSLPGRHIRDLLGERLYAANLPHIEGALRGEPQRFERAIPRPDGQGMRHSLSYYLPDVIEGKVRGFYVLVHDVTDLTVSRQKLAAAIRENEALLRTIRSHVLYSVADPGGTIIDVNEVLCHTSGYRRDQLIGQKHGILSSKTNGREFWAAMWTTLAAGAAWRGELCHRARDGSHFWTDTVIAPFFGEDGAVEKYVAIHTDITASKEAQRRLAASELFLERTGQLAGVGGWQLDLQSGELTWTSETRRIHEVAADYTPVAAAIIDFCAPEARPQIVAAVQAITANGGSFDLELPIVTAVGRPLWIRVVGEAEYAAEGDRTRPVRLIGAVQDLSSRHLANDALRAAKRAAEAASAAKSEFLAKMSHEIRTPLNAIIGLTYLLDRSALGDEQRRFVTSLQIAGRGLLGLVNDVLDLAKIEAGHMVLDEGPFSLHALLDDLAAVFGPQAQARRLELAFEVPAELPPLVRGDATRILQVLINLVGNAIKFTKQGSVRIVVTVTPRAADRIQACFVVRDTGIGIAPEVQARIFTPFEQADASTTRRFGGTGLGLSIVHHLVGMMDGEVSVHSVLGEGSEFRVVVPLGLPVRGGDEQDPAVMSAAEHGPRLTDIRILVVDDNEFNCEIASCILAGEGAIVATLGDGQTALEQLRDRPDAFDAVLMDVQMPGMDGNEATSRIRGELGLNELPVIALTAGALVAERQRAFDAGMSDFISKPLDPDSLVRLVRRHVDERRGPPRSMSQMVEP